MIMLILPGLNMEGRLNIWVRFGMVDILCEIRVSDTTMYYVFGVGSYIHSQLGIMLFDMTSTEIRGKIYGLIRHIYFSKSTGQE